MTDFWHELDEEIANTPMPEEYRNILVWILCKDCHQVSETPFHVIGLRCAMCGSYNTCRTAEPAALRDAHGQPTDELLDGEDARAGDDNAHDSAEDVYDADRGRDAHDGDRGGDAHHDA